MTQFTVAFKNSLRASDWYDSEGYWGLGSRFIETFYSYLPSLQDHHKVHRYVYNGFK